MNDLRQSSAWKGINPLALLKRPSVARWAPIPLRLIVGYGFTGSLFPRLTSWHGLPFLLNSFGGLAVLLGAFVALVSLPMGALLLVTMFTVHLPYGFSSIKRSS
jgi:putative oxidoreductase